MTYDDMPEPPIGTVVRDADGRVFERFTDGWFRTGSRGKWQWADIAGDETVELVEKPATPPPPPNLRDGDLDLWVHVRDGLYRLGAGSSLWPRRDIDRYYGPLTEEPS